MTITVIGRKGSYSVRAVAEVTRQRSNYAAATLRRSHRSPRHARGQSLEAGEKQAWENNEAV